MLTNDCVQLVLHHTCHLRIERYSKKLHGSLATGEGNKVFDIKQRPLILGNGMMDTNETTLLSYTIQPHGEGCVAVRSSELDKANTAAKDFELCLQDTIGDESGSYDDDRSADDEVFDRNAGPVRFPCLGWGQRRRLTYTIALSRSISTSIAFDALIVPTSWWIDDCEGTYWVVQMTNAEEIHEELYDVQHAEGCVVVGWKTDATSDD
jgi:hypothetical protein